jgi:Na+/melibiose symporter-like transporter
MIQNTLWGCALKLQNTFGIGETMTGTVMTMDNVLALFLLPFFGALSNRTDTRLGKRTPFIVFGTIAAVIFMILIPIADNMKSFPLFFISLGAVLFAMSPYTYLEGGSGGNKRAECLL